MRCCVGRKSAIFIFQFYSCGTQINVRDFGLNTMSAKLWSVAAFLLGVENSSVFISAVISHNFDCNKNYLDS